MNLREIEDLMQVIESNLRQKKQLQHPLGFQQVRSSSVLKSNPLTENSFNSIVPVATRQALKVSSPRDESEDIPPEESGVCHLI